MCLVAPLYLMAQGDDFGDPPHPGWDAVGTLYKVKTESVPHIGTTSHDNPREYKAGDYVYISASEGPGAHFVAWKDADENVVSEDSYYSFIMPAHDVYYYAYFTYDPGNPANPAFPPAQYTLTLGTDPLVAGSVSPSKPTLYEEGTSHHISTSANPGFIFQYWRDEATGMVVSAERSFYFLMPSHDSQLTAVYIYDPKHPGNPGANTWDSDLGVVRLSEFTPGNLLDMLNDVVGSSNREQVTHLTVVGEMADNDRHILYYVRNCSYFNMRETTGVTELDSYCNYDKSLQEIELPATITKLGSNTFKGCTMLQAIDIYATEPPTVGKNAFTDVPATMTVYVPEESVAAYQAADGWKDFTIRPMRDQGCQLEVTLPSECSDGRMKNMHLELTNIFSGKVYRYVVTDRLYYTFAHLLRHETYKAELKTPNGLLLGSVGPITLDNERESLAFTSLLQVFNVALTAHTKPSLEYPDGIDKTQDIKVLWEDQDDNFLAMGTTLYDQMEGNQVKYTVTLNEALAYDYLMPAAKQAYTVVAGNNDVSVVLEPFGTFTYKGKVVEKSSLQSKSGVKVNITQTLNGSYTQSSSAVTDEQGQFSVKLRKAPTQITLQYNGYNKEVLSLDETDIANGLDAAGNYDAGTLTIQPLEGTVLQLSHTYQESVFDGDPYNPLPYYTNYDNLQYCIYNETTAQDLTSLYLVHPSLRVSGAQPGDQLRVTCHSKSSEFPDVVQYVTIDADNRGSVTFPIVANGAVKSRILVNDNPQGAITILYNAEGYLYDKKKFETNDVYFNNVPDGHYMAVTMGVSKYYNSVYYYPEFAAMGLSAGTDYHLEEIDVQAGRICYVKTTYVPIFDESRYYYTGEATAFTIDKTNTIIENTLKLSARVDFKEKFRTGVSNAKLIVEIPAGTQLVEGSVMLGENISAYEFVDSKLSVDLGENFTDGVRFCIRPTLRGNFTPNAYVDFTYSDGVTSKQVTQPIGSVTYTATDLTIWAEPLIATPDLNIDGNAPGGSKVEVYDGNDLLGITRALGSGYWSLKTTLPNPKNLSVHAIHATAITTEGKELTSEVKAVEYNNGAIQAKDVIMTFFNNSSNKTVWVQWDLEHGTTSSKGYNFEAATDFVFKANLTNNDPEFVHDVVVRVFTHAHEWVDLPARYIENLDRWVAVGHFDHSGMPIGVRIAISADDDTDVDADLIEEANPNPTVDELAYISSFEWNLFRTNVPVEYSDAGYAEGYEIAVYTPAAPYLPAADDKVTEIETDKDNITVKYIETSDGTIIVEPSGSSVAWSFQPKKPVDWKPARPVATKPQDRIATEIVSDLKRELLLLSQGIAGLTSAIDQTRDALDLLIAVTFDPEKKAKLEIARDNVIACITVPRDLSWLMSQGHYAIEDINEWQAFIDRIRPCTGLDDAQAWAMIQQCEELKAQYGERYYQAMRAGNLVAFMLQHFTNDVKSTDLSDIDEVYNLVQTLRNGLSEYLLTISMEMYKQTKVMSRNRMRQMKRDRNRFDCNYTTMETIDDKWDFSVPYPIVTPIVDPSGYVYEAVPSNRQEGVTASVYYKHTYTDELGDERFEEILWDAEEYEQKNPLYTDEEGKYAWDVPAGEWRVKFEKEGYLTTYSEWLPVPPPQLDVNVGIVQTSQPVVAQVIAYEPSAEAKGGIDITFDKYMRPASLTKDRISLFGITGSGDESVNTALEDFTIVFNDEETDASGKNSYASKMSLLLENFVGYDKVLLHIDQLVESYAGVHMTEDFEQEFDVEKKIREIAIDSKLNIAFGAATTIRFAALPTEAAVGKTVVLTSDQGEILTLDEEGNAVTSMIVTLDADGQAEVTLNGVLIGTTALFVTSQSSDAKATAVVSVVEPASLEPVKSPEASRISGTSVFRGQSVTLTCETEGAQIWYTLDGSCPCEEEGRIKYEHPIYITEAVTIKAMAESVTGEVSEVKEFAYNIRQSDLKVNMAQGWNWTSHNLANNFAVTPGENVTSIRTQTQESFLDPEQGVVGDPIEADAAAALKIEMAQAAEMSFVGEQVNPSAVTIALQQGWNWIGCPLTETMTVEDALAYLDVEENDCLATLDGGFATYSQGTWTGDLKVLNPGTGYLYKSGSNKAFVYNVLSTVANPKALYAARLEVETAPWTVNCHQYPDMMPMVATIVDSKGNVMTDAYFVGAFSGEECRGVGRYADGMLYLSVYGQGNETLSFTLYDATTMESEEMTSTVTFKADMVGTVTEPAVLVAGNHVAITQIAADGAAAQGIYSISGFAVQRANLPGLYIQQGTDEQGNVIMKKMMVR